jgi:hypothetical protein
VKNWFRLTLALAVLGSSAAVGIACFSSSSSPPSGSSGGTTSSSGGMSSSGASSGGSGGGNNCMTVPLTPSATGFVPMVTALNPPIVGAWFSYGDNQGSTGVPPGDCITKGMHMTSDCSAITFPPEPSDGGTASFPQTTPGTMCLSGTAAAVIACVSGVCMGKDYSNIWGLGMGLDLNNPNGTPATYNATMAGIKNFTFNVTGLPAATVRVEFSTPETDPSGDAWSYTLTGNGATTVDLTKLSPSFNMSEEPVFDPTQIEAIQFHVVTGSSPVTFSDFCIDSLAVTVCM